MYFRGDWRPMTTSYPRILCPLALRDDSERHVLRCALELAAVLSTSVQAVHVYSRGPEPDSPSELAHDVARPARERFAEYLEGTTGGDAALTVLEGKTAERILDEAGRLDVDFLVMGTHGRSALGRLLLGSVAARVLRASTVPTIAVPYTKAEPSSPSSILVAHDLVSLASSRALELARRLQLAFGDPPVTLVHALSPRAGDVEQRRWDVTRQLERDVERAFGSTWRDSLAIRVVDPGKSDMDRVLSVGLEVGADLMIVGTSTKTGVGRLGSTATGLLGRSRVPVLVVPSILKEP